MLASLALAAIRRFVRVAWLQTIAHWSKILSAAVTTGKTLSRAVYVFSPDNENSKVAHVNFLPKEVLERKVLDAKSWLEEVSKVIGGKARLIRTCVSGS